MFILQCRLWIRAPPGRRRCIQRSSDSCALFSRTQCVHFLLTCPDTLAQGFEINCLCTHLSMQTNFVSILQQRHVFSLEINYAPQFMRPLHAILKLVILRRTCQCHEILRKLTCEHGVHPGHRTRLRRALVRANVRYELMLISART